MTDAVPDTGYTADLDLPDPVLQEALLSPSERQRSLLVLRHVVGLPAGDVAKVMSTNRGAVYAATARAEHRLRQLLAVESDGRPASVPIKDMGK